MSITTMKMILREKDMPMFEDEEIQDMIKSTGSEEEALYQLLILKSENTGLQLSGLTMEDTSSYFKRLASTYRPHNTGILGSVI